MQRATTIPFSQFLFGLKTAGDNPWLVVNRLRKPGSVTWPEDEKGLQAAWRQGITLLPEPLHNFYFLALTAHLLLTSSSRKISLPHWLLQENPAVRLLTPAIISATPGSWRAVPVVTVSGKTPAVHYFLVALTAENNHPGNIPPWAVSFFDAPALEAISAALAAAQQETGKKHPLVLWPVVSPDGYLNPIQQQQPLKICGRSLGLPVAMGAMAVLKQRPVNNHWLATGQVSPSGRVLPVSALTEKARAADQGYTLLLFPAESVWLPQQATNVTCRAVAHVAQAQLWAENFTCPAAAQVLQRLDTALQSPMDFVNNCGELSATLLTVGRETSLAESITDAILQDGTLAWELAKKLEMLLRKPGDHSAATALAQWINQEGSLRTMGGSDPKAALSWCASHLALANHRGDNAAADHWFKMGQSFAVQAKRERDGRQLYFTLINRRHGVNERHNRYQFDPELSAPLQEILEIQSRQNANDGGFADYLLGSLYGTQAQNFAFCGPAYLAETRKSLAAACRAFGYGKVPSLKKDWLRQQSYLLFALLDAELWVEAAETLIMVLAIDQPPETIDPDNYPDRFDQYALARFLADTQQVPELANWRIVGEKMVASFEQHRLQTGNHHPWQLWHYNIGRLALGQGKTATAKRAWQHSVAICEQNEETVRVMALLTLVALVAVDQDKEWLFKKAGELRQWLGKSTTLSLSHFQIFLTAPDIEESLRMANINMKQLFPFTYR